MKSLPFSPASLFLAGAAGLLMLFLAVGWLLPGTWQAERSAVLQAPPAEVFPWVDSSTGWRKWTPWPDSGIVHAGPARGAGSRLTWNDAQLGNGTFVILAAEGDSLVRYRVSVQDSTMHTEGVLRLAPEGAGTRVTWREQGDFGRNPLMGYWARFMSRAQGAELEKSLARLDSLASTGSPPADTVHAETEAPADTGSTGASR